MSKNNNKTNEKTDKSRGQITQYLNKNTPQSMAGNKCLCSRLSPAKKEKLTKKANMSEINSNPITKKKKGKDEQNANNQNKGTSINELKSIISRLIEEIKSLRETVHSDIKGLQEVVKTQQQDIIRLEESISLSHQKVKDHLLEKIDQNSEDIQKILMENKQLHKENDALMIRLTKIETLQLENKVIISGQPEQPWEMYETTKQQVLDTIASTIGSATDNYARQEAAKIEIISCSRIGKYKMGKARPISVTFQCKEDNITY